ncbi:MAG: SDR family NAD(P)-dependent oxidoreductase [Burkholderiaceae bacterium]
MDLQLTGRTCLITGASSGIGHGLAQILAREGVRLALAGRQESALVALRDELAEQGLGEATVCVGDVTTADGVAAVCDQAQAGLGVIEMLVNNAGGSRPLAGAGTDEEWAESMALNFSAARRMSTRLVPGMVQAGWGRVINVSGAVVAPNVNAAAPAKAALVSWSKSLATELAPKGITVNCVAPGRISTRQILENLHPTAESRQAYIDQYIPMGRFGEPAEIANVIAFYLSPLSNYVTSTTVPVDGGLHRLAF